jgi:hypothetical protein
MENMEDKDKDAHDAIADDLSSTIVLKHPSQPGGWEGDYNTVDRDLQSNAHSSLSLLGCLQLVRHQYQYHHIQDPTADTGPAGNLHESQPPTTITFTNPMTNPSELEAMIHSTHQQPT